MADAYDPESDPQVQKYKYLLGLQPKPPDINAIMPAPALPGHVDMGTPQIKDALDRYDKASLINGITSTRTPNWYQVQHGGTTHQAPSPTFDAVKEATLRPVQSAMGMMEHQNAIADTLNKYNEAKGKVAGQMAGSQNRMGAAEFAAMTGAGARTDAANINANSRTDAAHIGARAKLDAIRAQVEAGTLSPEAIDRFAEQLNSTGVLPRIPGRGPAATAQAAKVANTAAAKAGPTGAPLASAGASYKANTGSLSAAQKLADTTDAQEQTASKNLDQFMEVAGHMTDAGSPLLNKPARWLELNAAGDPTVAAFHAARQVAATEVARVLQGNSGLTDSARNEIGSFAPDDATGAQLMAVTKIIKKDMANRHAAQQGQLGAIQGRIAPPAAGGKTWVKNQTNSKTGAKRGVYSDGSYGDAQ